MVEAGMLVDDLKDKLLAHEVASRRLRAEIVRELNKQSPLPKVYEQIITDQYSVYRGDSVQVIKGIPSESIHYSIFSPPFSNLFCYSASLRDMGNSTDEQFYSHFDYLVPEMFRTTIPGRLCTLHCSDIPAMKERDGWMGLKDFPGELRIIMERHGWIYHSRHVIWKNPLIEVTRTKVLGLMHKQLVKDSSRVRAGLPDYLMTFMKPGENPFPIAHGRGFEDYVGEDAEPRQSKSDDPATNKYSHHVWERYASPVWMDIKQTNTLNVRLAREKNDERHICPLQLDVIARCLELWSLPGETIASWFAGIGSEGYQSLLMGRKFIGVELKDAYYKVMIRYLKQISSHKKSSLMENL